MSARMLDIVQGTQKWHDWRKTGIGASDAAALFNESPYKTMRDLFLEKAGFGTADDEDRSYIYRKGHEAEAEIRDLFIKHTKIPIKPVCFENGIFLASLDGHESTAILEAKLVGKEVLKTAAATGKIPRHHYIQTQTQLFVSESEICFWGAKAPKVKDGVVVEIRRDEKLIAEIQEKGERFWASLQTMDVPPLTPLDTMFLSDPTLIEFAAELETINQKMKELGARYEEIEKALKAAATHTRVRCGNVSITHVERAGSIDFKKIPEVKALAQDYLETFRGRATVSKRLTFKKVD